MVQLLRRAGWREAETTTTEREPVSGARAAVVDRILVLNPTATEAYLEAFSDRSLERYVEHLESMGAGRGVRWERPGDSPAIMVHESAE